MPDILAAVFLVDGSRVLTSEWAPVVMDYLAPYTRHIVAQHKGFEIRAGCVCYGLSSSRPSSILSKKWFQHVGKLRNDVLDKPSQFGLGQIGSEADESGMAVLDGIVAAMELLDVLHKAVKRSSSKSGLNQSQLVSTIIHVAACPPDASRHPIWNNDSEFDHISWETLPQELRLRNIHYSMVLLRPNSKMQEIFSSVCPADETIAPWFAVRPCHQCLLWSPNKALTNFASSGSHTTFYVNRVDFPRVLSAIPEQQQLLKQYHMFQSDMDRFAAAMNSGRITEAQLLQDQLIDQIPFYLELHQYFSSMTRQPIMIEHGSLHEDQHCSPPDLGLCDAMAEDTDETSVFTEVDSPFPEKIIGCKETPFGVDLTDYPPRVITQIQATSPSMLCASTWQGELSWAGLDPTTHDRKLIKIAVLALGPNNNRDLRSKTWPRNIILVPSSDERVSESEFRSWIKKYDPIWCQLLPCPKQGTCATLNEIVFRQLVYKLLDENIYVSASWNLPNGSTMRNNLIILPFGTQGLVGAVFASVGSLELPKAKSSSSSSSSSHPTEVGTPSECSLLPPVFQHYEGLLADDASVFATNNVDETVQSYIQGELYIPEFETFAPWIRSMTAFETSQQVEEGNCNLGLGYDEAEMIRRLTAEGLAEVSMPLAPLIDYAL